MAESLAGLTLSPVQTLNCLTFIEFNNDHEAPFLGYEAALLAFLVCVFVRLISLLLFEIESYVRWLT